MYRKGTDENVEVAYSDTDMRDPEQIETMIREAVEQVSELVLFLCSGKASTITGSVLPIDSGWTAQ